MALSFILFAATCVERVRPYLKGILKSRGAGAQAPALGPAPARSTELKLASWNMHFLDVPGRGPDGRGQADYAALRRYARALDADVIAVQEVASVEALALVFPADVYTYYLAEMGGAQRSGFVYRKRLHTRVYPDLRALGLSDLRAGADLGVQSRGRELRLLSVHLKAFCVTGSLAHEGKHCAKLRAQIPVLEGWIDARARESVPFAVLGDFNRALGEPHDPLFLDLDDGDPVGLRLLRASARTHSECRGKHQHAVDHVLLGGLAAGWLVAPGLSELAYAEGDLQAGLRLSDHCPIRLVLSAPAMR